MQSSFFSSCAMIGRNCSEALLIHHFCFHLSEASAVFFPARLLLLLRMCPFSPLTIPHSQVVIVANCSHVWLLFDVVLEVNRRGKRLLLNREHLKVSWLNIKRYANVCCISDSGRSRGGSVLNQRGWRRHSSTPCQKQTKKQLKKKKIMHTHKRLKVASVPAFI